MKLATRAFCCAVMLAFAGAAGASGDAQKGKAKAASCGACHGTNGEGKKPNPPIAGTSEAKFVQAMKEYKSGKRQNALMKGAVAPLGDQDIDNLAAYYASLKK